MKFSTVAFIAASVAVVSAQLDAIPACARSCLLEGITATGCSLTDFKCSCSNKQFITDSTACIQKSCEPADVIKAAEATYQLCKSVGIEIPTQGPTQAPSTTAAPTKSEEPKPEPTKSEEPPKPTTDVPPPSYSSSAPPPPPVYSSTLTTATTVAPPAQNTTAPTPTYSQPPIATGGAIKVAGSVFLAAGGAVAALLL